MKRWHVVQNLVTGEVTKEEVPEGVDVEEFLRERMHDCPECQAARARGEVPHVVRPTGHRRRFPRPMRWRKRKRTGAGT